jgi:hypothetical protein
MKDGVGWGRLDVFDLYLDEGWHEHEGSAM